MAKASNHNPEATVPSDLKKALGSNPKALSQWQKLTPIAKRDFIIWVEMAKKEETRQHRIERTQTMVSQGKRRPCCYTFMPADLYKQFQNNPKLKSQWSTLTATEKRDFACWVDIPREANDRKMRVEQACKLITQGKKHP